MNRNYLRQRPGRFHLSRLILYVLNLIYMNIVSCGQNAFGAHANVDSTSDSEFVHISERERSVVIALISIGFSHVGRSRH